MNATGYRFEQGELSWPSMRVVVEGETGIGVREVSAQDVWYALTEVEDLKLALEASERRIEELEQTLRGICDVVVVALSVGTDVLILDDIDPEAE